MAEFDQTIAKEPNRYEIIGIQEQALKVMNQVFELEFTEVIGIYAEKKFFLDEINTFSKFEKFHSYFLNEANDLIFCFEDKEENYSYYYLDLSVFNSSNKNPLKLIKE